MVSKENLTTVAGNWLVFSFMKQRIGFSHGSPADFPILLLLKGSSPAIEGDGEGGLLSIDLGEGWPSEHRGAKQLDCVFIF